MTRVLVTLAVIASFAGRSDAGWKCRKQPSTVFWSPSADVHEDGVWHRAGIKGNRQGELTGTLSKDALATFLSFKDSGAKTDKVIECLDWLIEYGPGKTVPRACKPRAKSS